MKLIKTLKVLETTNLFDLFRVQPGAKWLGGVSIICLLAACGGDGSNSQDSPPPIVLDTQAPNITFSASDAAPQGGETIILSATVVDNVDTNINVCNKGSRSVKTTK